MVCTVCIYPLLYFYHRPCFVLNISVIDGDSWIRSFALKTFSFNSCVTTYYDPIWTTYEYSALLEKLIDDAVAYSYVTKFSTIFLYLTKLYVT